MLSSSDSAPSIALSMYAKREVGAILQFSPHINSSGVVQLESGQIYSQIFGNIEPKIHVVSPKATIYSPVFVSQNYNPRNIQTVSLNASYSFQSESGDSIL